MSQIRIKGEILYTSFDMIDSMADNSKNARTRRTKNFAFSFISAPTIIRFALRKVSSQHLLAEKPLYTFDKE